MIEVLSDAYNTSAQRVSETFGQISLYETLKQINDSPITLLTVLAVISIYALIAMLRLFQDSKRVTANLDELRKRLDNDQVFLYQATDETSDNEFLKAWHTLLLHQKKPKDRNTIKDKYLERHPSFYINSDLLKKADFSLKKYHRQKQNIYLLAIFFTFAGILLALVPMVSAFSTDDPAQQAAAVPEFLRAVALKFSASLAGIFWMLLFGWSLGKKEDYFDREIANIHAKITAIFGGGFDLGFDVQLDQNAVQLFGAVESLKRITGHLINAIQAIEETPINRSVEGIHTELKNIQSHLREYIPKTGEEINQRLDLIVERSRTAENNTGNA